MDASERLLYKIIGRYVIDLYAHAGGLGAFRAARRGPVGGDAAGAAALQPGPRALPLRRRDPLPRLVRARAQVRCSISGLLGRFLWCRPGSANAGFG
jgi:hypothetical protein